MNSTQRKKRKSQEQVALYRAFILAGVVALAITPKINYDPINIVKFSLVVLISGFLLPYSIKFFLLDGESIFEKRILKLIKLSVLILIVGKIASDIFNLRQFSQQLYGTYGRNTGLLAYISLSLILCASIYLGKRAEILTPEFRLVFCLSFLILIYGTLQSFGFDPIDWNNPYNQVIITLGNPNFSSAFIGMLFAFLFPFVLTRTFAGKLRTLLVVNCSLLAWLSTTTDALQGSMLIFISIFINLILIGLKSRQWKKPAIVFLILGLPAAGFLAISFFGKGPLGLALGQETLKFRFEYWRTAIAASRENLFLGLGSDSFGEYFRTYRDKQTLDLVGQSTFTSSAHNVLLDHLANSGVIVFLAMSCLVIITLYLAIRKFRSMEAFNPFFVGVFSLYVTYLIQSLISIDQLGLTLWGWFAQGLLIGLSLEKVQDSHRLRHEESKVLLSWAGVVTSAAIMLPNFSADLGFSNALKVGDVNRVIMVVTRFPLESERIRFAVDIFQKQGFEKEANDLSTIGIKLFPNSFLLLSQRISLPQISADERAQLMNRLKEIDPLVVISTS